MRLRSLLAIVPIALVVAPGAQAAGWKQITAPDGANTDQVGLLRTADGTLHVAWRHRNGTGEDLLHTTIGANGKPGATTSIVRGWANVQNPALVSVPGGIRAFWGALRSTDTMDPIDTIATALSPNGGASWALQPTSVVPDDAQAYASPTSAAVLPSGTPLQTWFGTYGVWAHAGLAGTPGSDHNLQAPLGCCGYDSNIAIGSDGRPVVAWFSNATGHLGVHAQSVAPDGSPLGGPLTMPGTSNMEVSQIGRTPIVARAGGGSYVATAAGYPSLNRVRVWRVGAQRSTVVGKASGGASATVAAAADGRLWVAWEDDRGADPHVYVRRSNRSATAWGATVDMGRPKGAAGAYHLDASAIGSSLDVLTSFVLGTGSPLATYHRRVRPGLTLTAKPGSVRRGKDVKVTFRVLDAGDPVKGATVRAGGHSGKTNRKGRVTLTVHAGRKASARATAPGYTGAVRRLKVRR
jgi:hypothetical protein